MRQSPKPTQSEVSLPLYVDLDGTLIRGDLFLEGILRLVKAQPILLFSVLAWLLRGRSYCKYRVSKALPDTPPSVTYNSDVVSYIQAEKAAGRAVYLATAAPETMAAKIAEETGLFDGVLTSTEAENLKGRVKADKIVAHNGNAHFAYIGDSAADKAIWDVADKALTVNVDASVASHYESLGKLEHAFTRKSNTLAAFLKAIRPHQWAKNILIFVPLAVSHSYGDIGLVLTSLLAFAAFSLCASGVYLLNDLLDLEADRLHPRKSKRPLAAGTLPLKLGLAGAFALPALAFAMSLLFLPAAFTGGLAAYYAITNAYSFYLKSKPTVDVLTLAILYTTRIVVGGLAIGVALTSWLLVFSFFLFLSLAYLKRYIEVADRGIDSGFVPGRGYAGVDTEGLFMFGVGAMYAASVVLALYVDSSVTTTLYQTPELLWVMVIVLLFWGNRIWVAARRGKVNEDPIVFAIRDRTSLVAGLIVAAATVAARYV